ncbi:MAG: YlxM family DNA-binding protein [Clostridiales bacterium]|nr:YlxM family DNA-binding protein [Clostridiales bacterium]
MPQKNMQVALLLDYYGGMLTDKQRGVIDLYYNEDLSLAEIAEHVHITRQGVRDSIKRGEEQLFEMERRLGLVARIRTLEQAVAEVRALAEAIERFALANVAIRPVADLTGQIRRILGALEEGEAAR